jgi:hypothetical protein
MMQFAIPEMAPGSVGFAKLTPGQQIYTAYPVEVDCFLRFGGDAG